MRGTIGVGTLYNIESKSLAVGVKPNVNGRFKILLQKYQLLQKYFQPHETRVKPSYQKIKYYGAAIPNGISSGVVVKHC